MNECINKIKSLCLKLDYDYEDFMNNELEDLLTEDDEEIEILVERAKLEGYKEGYTDGYEDGKGEIDL